MDIKMHDEDTLPLEETPGQNMVDHSEVLRRLRLSMMKGLES